MLGDSAKLVRTPPRENPRLLHNLGTCAEDGRHEGVHGATCAKQPGRPFAKADRRVVVNAGGSDFPGEELLRTRRLRLRGFCMRDLLDLRRLGQEPRVSELLIDRPLSGVGEIREFLVWINQIYLQRPGLGIWRADNAQDEFLGFFSMMPEQGSGAISLGSRLLPRTWGRGYALEGGAALCEHAFTTLQLPRLIGKCDPRNRSVPPLLARLGFVADGQVLQAGKPELRFVLLREDWTGIRRRVHGARSDAGLA